MAWSLIGRAGRDGALDGLWQGYASSSETPQARATATALLRASQGHHVDDARSLIDHESAVGQRAGARLITVLDQD